MRTVDFRRSFLMFRIDLEKKPPQTVSHKPPYSLNNARIQLECRCHITESETGQLQTFVLGASCKTERVGVERDIWTEPNADFVPIFSDEGFLNVKTFARVGTLVKLYPPTLGTQPDRQVGALAEAFDSAGIHVVECEGEPLGSAREIVEATLANQPLVGRTELESGRYTAVLEYPVKTINANERDWIYQTDTGPVLLPDFSVEPEELLAKLELAFAAFNCPDWVEFLVRVPTDAGEGVQVYHYSRPVRFDARNQVIRVA